MKLAVVVAIACAVACNNDSSSKIQVTNRTPDRGPAAPVAPAGNASAGDCAHVADHLRAVWDKQVADADSEHRQEVTATGAKLTSRLERHCRDDKWSAALVECVRKGGACDSLMTPQQRDLLDADDPNRLAPAQ